MLRSVDDLILHRLTEGHKSGAVAGYSNQQIGIVFRMPLRIKQGFPIDDIELYVLATASEMVGASAVR